MKHIFLILITLMSTGCYVSQRSQIQKDYEVGWNNLHMQCKNNYNTEYCKEQYRHLNSVRERDLAQDKDLEARSDRTGVIAAVIVVSTVVVVGSAVAITCIQQKTCDK